MALSLSGTTGIVTANIAASNITTATIADANVTPGKLSQPMTLATAQNATGTSVDFTSIPSWAKRITVMLNEVSAATASALQVQIGDSGGVETTGYAVNTSVVRGAYAGAVGNSTSTSGFVLQNYSTSTADSVSGHLILTNISGNIWVGSGLVSVGPFNSYDVHMFAGTKTLSSVLDRVRLTTLAAATLDAGSINIMYEG